MNKTAKWTCAAGLLLVAAACVTEASNEGLLARVDGYELSVDDAVDLLVDEERLAAEVGVVESLGELWIDYILFAEATAKDSTYPDLDFEPLVMQQVQQSMVFQFRDSVIQVDTFVTEDELSALYEAEAPEVALRASHIMFGLPLGATEAERDSVRTRLEVIGERIAGGESFSALARQLSQDPGTAARGGDLGYFGRGDMVAPFEEAAFALEPGEVSDVVETPMGLHLIRLDERRVEGFETAAPRFRRQVQARMVQEAESVFVAGLYERASPVMAEGAPEIVRDVAANPGARLAGRAERRALVEWDGGGIRVGDLRTVFQLESPSLRTQVVDGSDEEIERFLESLARRELLIRAAEAEGLRPGRDSLDVLVEDARAQLRGAARMLGLDDLDQAPGEARDVAIARAVEEALRDNLTGATQVVPLGLIGFRLREGRSASVFEAGIGEVILEVARIRAARSLAPAEESAVGALVPDTAGG